MLLLANSDLSQPSVAALSHAAVAAAGTIPRAVAWTLQVRVATGITLHLFGTETNCNTMKSVKMGADRCENARIQTPARKPARSVQHPWLLFNPKYSLGREQDAAAANAAHLRAPLSSRLDGPQLRHPPICPKPPLHLRHHCVDMQCGRRSVVCRTLPIQHSTHTNHRKVCAKSRRRLVSGAIQVTIRVNS
jgi:hypothetical protein